jgi:hypothetical protein
MAKGAVGEKGRVEVEFDSISPATAWGDEAVGFRAKFSLLFEGGTSSASGNVIYTAYSDLIFVRVGREVCIFVLSNTGTLSTTGTPFDDALRNSLIAATAQRMKG